MNPWLRHFQLKYVQMQIYVLQSNFYASIFAADQPGQNADCEVIQVKLLISRKEHFNKILLNLFFFAKDMQ